MLCFFPPLLFPSFPGTKSSLQSSVFHSSLSFLGFPHQTWLRIVFLSNWNCLVAPGFDFSSVCFQPVMKFLVYQWRGYLPRLSLLSEMIVCEISLSKTNIFSCSGFPAGKKKGGYCHWTLEFLKLLWQRDFKYLLGKVKLGQIPGLGLVEGWDEWTTQGRGDWGEDAHIYQKVCWHFTVSFYLPILR